MRTRVLLRALAVISIMLMAGALVWGLTASRRVALVYHGKALRAWMADFHEVPANREAAVAVRHIGSNAVPTVLRMFCANDDAINARLLATLAKHRALHLTYVPTSLQHENALGGFEALGGAAESAVPRLIKMHDALPSRHYEVTLALSYVGPAAKGAIPCLLRDLTNKDNSIRCDSLWALGRIHAEPKLVVPVMIMALRDPDDGIRYTALAGLFEFGTDAAIAVPALREVLGAGAHHEAPPTRLTQYMAEQALRTISGEKADADSRFRRPRRRR